MTTNPIMKPQQYLAALDQLGYSPYGAAPLLGISLRQSHRYASGEQIVAEPIRRLLFMYLRHGIPAELR